MPITTALSNSFKAETLQALHNFTAGTGNQFKVALIRAGHTGTYGAASTNYSNITGNSDESTVGGGGSGYTATGANLTSVTPTLDSSTAVCDFTDTVWTLSGASATLAADGCMIYNSTNGNRAASLHAFAGSPSASGAGATFTITWPAPAGGTAVIRLA
jgi:hypothetical protein